MKTCTSCRKFDTCPSLCQEMQDQVNTQPPRKAITNEEKISYAIFVLTTAGMNPLQILEVSRYVAKIQKNTLYRSLPKHIEDGKEMIDYYLSGYSKFSLQMETI